MAISVYIHSNDLLIREVPGDNDHFFLRIFGNTEETLMNSDPQLSTEKFGILLDELADKFIDLVGPNFPPLSDYAVSREGIYEDHL